MIVSKSSKNCNLGIARKLKTRLKRKETTKTNFMVQSLDHQPQGFVRTFILIILLTYGKEEEEESCQSKED